MASYSKRGPGWMIKKAIRKLKPGESIRVDIYDKDTFAITKDEDKALSEIRASLASIKDEQKIMRGALEQTINDVRALQARTGKPKSR